MVHASPGNRNSWRSITFRSGSVFGPIAWVWVFRRGSGGEPRNFPRRALQLRTRRGAGQTRNAGADRGAPEDLVAVLAWRRHRIFLERDRLFRKVRQIEEVAERVLVYYEPVTFLLTSDDYPGICAKCCLRASPRSFRTGRGLRRKSSSSWTCWRNAGPRSRAAVPASRVSSAQLRSAGCCGPASLEHMILRNPNARSAAWLRARRSSGSPA